MEKLLVVMDTGLTHNKEHCRLHIGVLQFLVHTDVSSLSVLMFSSVKAVC